MPVTSVSRHHPVDVTNSILDAYAAAAGASLLREGFKLSIRTDMREWASILRHAPATNGVNPSFDPDQTGSALDAFWLCVEARGQVVAVAASKLIEANTGYYEYVRQGLLWCKPPGEEPIDILISESGPAGLLAHSGGLWVHPDYRRIGLSWLVPRLNQAWSQIEWGVDWIASVIFSDIHDKGLPLKYGAKSCRVLIDGWFAPKGQRELIYSAEYPGDHLLRRAANDLSLLHRHPDQKMRDLAPTRGQRHHQLTI
ncbi:MAG: hypothetical protein HQ481_10950 [Alphaproteobacteria bacterium]|nr:hypothetical protein [Alphaproteobacteria bacterium]